MGDSLTRQPVVLDNGGGVVKIGFAGEDKPGALVANLVGRPKHVRVMAGGALEGDVFVGRKAAEHRGALVLRHAMSHGVTEDWDAAGRVWAHGYELINAAPREHPLLITEAPLNPRSHRERAAEALFEGLGAPALAFASPPQLALYASGRTTGLVVDCGDGVTYAVPVYEGFANPTAMVRVDVGGRDVSAALALQLRRSGAAFSTSADGELAREIKEAACVVAADPAAAEAAAREGRGEGAPVDYRLPDGTRLRLGPEVFRAPEVLFSPRLAGIEADGVADAAAAALARSDVDLRRALLSSVVLAGGSTALPGFGARLLRDLRAGAPPDARIRIWAPAQRASLAWIGGSILASLGSFRGAWLTRAAWDEAGPAALHRAGAL